MLILQPQETRGLISMAEAVEATEVAFHDWGLSHGLNAPRRRVHVPSGVRVSVHQGGTPSLGMTGLFTHCELVHPMASHQEYDVVAHPAYLLFDGTAGPLLSWSCRRCWMKRSTTGENCCCWRYTR